MKNRKERYVLFFSKVAYRPSLDNFFLWEAYYPIKGRKFRSSLDLVPNSLSVILQVLAKRLFLDELELIAFCHESSISWEIPLRKFDVARSCPFLFDLSGDIFCRKNPGRRCPFFHPTELFNLSCDFIARINFVKDKEFEFKKGDRFYVVVPERGEYNVVRYVPRLWVCLSDCHLQ